MTTFALNNLWTYLQGLTLSQTDREWLANKLIMPEKVLASGHKTHYVELSGSLTDDDNRLAVSRN